MSQQIPGPSHIPIAEGRLLLGACGKVAYLFNRILGISSLLEMIWGVWSFPRVPVLQFCSYRLETGVSGNLWSFPKEAKAIVLYDGEWGISLKPMQRNWSSFQVDLGYTELFHKPAVTSLSF